MQNVPLLNSETEILSFRSRIHALTGIVPSKQSSAARAADGSFIYDLTERKAEGCLNRCKIAFRTII